MVTTTRASRILEVDARAETLLGSDATFVVGKPLASFVELWDRRGFRSKLAVFPDGGCERDWRFRLRSLRGRIVPVVAAVEEVRGEHGAEGSYLSWTLVEDQSSLTRVDGVAAPSGDDLEQALSKIRHDLNQPLAAIMAFASGCLRRSRSDVLLRAELESALESIIAEVNRAGDIVGRHSKKRRSS